MSMQGRQYTADFYRFGYQGSEKEREGELKGIYTTEFRGLDVRLGRWFIPDPITHPSQSPYCSMDNDPIGLTDVMGLSTDGGDPSTPSGNPPILIADESSNCPTSGCTLNIGPPPASGDFFGGFNFANFDFSGASTSGEAAKNLPERKGTEGKDWGSQKPGNDFETIAKQNDAEIESGSYQEEGSNRIIMYRTFEAVAENKTYIEKQLCVKVEDRIIQTEVTWAYWVKGDGITRSAVFMPPRQVLLPRRPLPCGTVRLMMPTTRNRRINGNISFTPGGRTLLNDPITQNELNRIGRILRGDPTSNVTITLNTMNDVSMRPRDFGDAMLIGRFNSISQFLQGNYGVSAGRITMSVITNDNYNVTPAGGGVNQTTFDIRSNQQVRRLRVVRICP